jgi:hypothetical protein
MRSGTTPATSVARVRTRLGKFSWRRCSPSGDGEHGPARSALVEAQRCSSGIVATRGGIAVIRRDFLVLSGASSQPPLGRSMTWLVKVMLRVFRSTCVLGALAVPPPKAPIGSNEHEPPVTLADGLSETRHFAVDDEAQLHLVHFRRLDRVERVASDASSLSRHAEHAWSAR